MAAGAGQKANTVRTVTAPTSIDIFTVGAYCIRPPRREVAQHSASMNSIGVEMEAVACGDQRDRPGERERAGEPALSRGIRLLVDPQSPGLIRRTPYVPCGQKGAQTGVAPQQLLTQAYPLGQELPAPQALRSAHCTPQSKQAFCPEVVV